MLDPRTLLPEIQKLVPQYSPQEVMSGIQELQQAHPDLDNQGALQAVTMALAQQKQSAPKGRPFEGLINQVGAR